MNDRYGGREEELEHYVKEEGGNEDEGTKT